MAFDPAGQFRRSGQRDERRRRLLADDGLQTDEGGKPLAGRRRTVCHKSEHYGDAEFLDNARRAVDFVPRSLWVWALLLVLGVGLIVGLEFLYFSMPNWCPSGQTLAAFDLGADDSLASWFTSLLWLTSSVVALVIYSMRRHRTDDYRGRYRIWMAAAACWFLLATDEAASLHEALQVAIGSIKGMPVWGDGSIWWMTLYGLLLGAVTTRLIIDMRESRLGLSLFTLVILAGAVDFAVRFGLVALPEPAHRIMAIEASEMAAGLFLLVSMGLFARHVLLDAEGQLPRREPKVEKPAAALDKPTETADNVDDEYEADEPEAMLVPVRTAATVRTVDPPHPTPAKPKAPGVSPAVNSPVSDGGKLTKAERKALKQKLIQERLNRQKQQQTKWK